MSAAAFRQRALLGVLIAGCVACARTEDSNGPVPGNKVSALMLRPDEVFGDGRAVRGDMPAFSDIESGPLQAGLYQNKDKLRLAFRLAPAAPPASASVDLVLGFDPVCFFIKGQPVLEEDMLKNTYGYSTGPGTSWTGSALARAARLLRPYDKKPADRCTSIAEEVYELDRAVDLSKPEYEDKRGSHLWLQTGLLMTDIELYQLTKEHKYTDDAQESVTSILALQHPEGWFYFDQASTSGKYAECRFHLFALYEFLKHNPGSELNAPIKDAFRRWPDYNTQSARVSNFGQIGGIDEDRRSRNLYASNYPNRRVGAFGWGLATAAMLLEEPDHLEATERQIQWIAGLNPADVSLMAGVGKGPGCYHHRYGFMKACEDGVVAGGTLNGLMSGDGDALYLGDTDTKNFVIAQVLLDYPVIDTDVWGWTYPYAGNEYWARNSASFVMGAFQVEKAARELR